MASPFAERRWGSTSSPLRGPMTALAKTRVGSWVVRRSAGVDRRVLRASKGRFTVLGPIGAPTLLLTTTGAKSGLARTSPLLYARDGDDIFVVGSNFGQEHHPAWTANLLANPACTVNTAGAEVDAVATLLDGPERERIYRLFESDVTDVYSVYRDRTDREIRVFRLSAS